VQDAIAVLIGASVVLSVYDIHVAPRLGREPLPEPVVPSAIIKLVQIDRDWNLFAPDPMTDDGWWVVVGTDESGAALDPLTGAPPVWDKPDKLAYRNNRLWRKYLYRLWLNKYIPYRPYLAATSVPRARATATASRGSTCTTCSRRHSRRARLSRSRRNDF
jgi:hypothetical protein